MRDHLPRALTKWAFSQSGEALLNVPMVWISGPRQVGKTSLARLESQAYYNWDTIEVRKAYSRDPYFFRDGSSLVIFDEIHKRKDWKKLLKGYYDSPSRRENFLVTGSGRMDVYRKSGDSLQGRYNLFTLWPLLFDEVTVSGDRPSSEPRVWVDWKPDLHHASDHDLITFGGFPQPFLWGETRKLVRWQDQYIERLVREDVRDWSAVERLDQMDLLARLLPTRVGSPLSLLSVSRDVEVSPIAIKSWLRVFEMLYFGFQLKPFHRKLHRAVKRETKWYFYQWTFVEDEALRFENYLAVQLAAACSAWSEQGYGRYELCYVRDQDRREVDFVIVRNQVPIALIEAKNSFQAWPASLSYYCQKLNIPGFLVYPGQKDAEVRRHDRFGWTLPSSRFLRGLVLAS